MKLKPKTIALLVVLAVVLFVLLQNMREAEINLLFWEIEMPLLVLMLSTLFLGWVVGWFTHLIYHKGKSKRYPEVDPPHGSGTKPATATPSIGEETTEK